MEALLNVDLAACLVSGVVLAVTSICVSSMLPDMSPPTDMEEESEHEILNKTAGTTVARSATVIEGENGETYSQSDINEFVAAKMAEKLVDKVPPSLMNEDEIRKVVAAASEMNASQSLSDEDVNIFSILSWVLFIAVLVLSYYMAETATDGELTRVLKGFFPREFAFFQRARDKYIEYSAESF